MKYKIMIQSLFCGEYEAEGKGEALTQAYEEFTKYGGVEHYEIEEIEE